MSLWLNMPKYPEKEKGGASENGLGLQARVYRNVLDCG
jgi:hypothetical protein